MSLNELHTLDSSLILSFFSLRCKELMCSEIELRMKFILFSFFSKSDINFLTVSWQTEIVDVVLNPE